ncbi:MAG: class I SAM-dependent methyltransferase [Sterolibacterium sp.]|jgi:16S rRNA (guanine1207-N2)-methyltransferase|nr:class I SAM-dependent methyltransferase [Sterolibacterium sp.]
MSSDLILDTLLLPFTQGTLAWPSQGTVLFLRARAGQALDSVPRDRLQCVQSFKPWADALLAAGYPLVAGEPAAGAQAATVLLLLPRQREEARALLAQALQRVSPGGYVVAALFNNEGARSGEADLARLAGAAHSLSKHKARVFWAQATAACDRTLMATWAELDAPRSIAGGRFISRPGLFAWSRIDAASALLARCLPDDLKGRGADLGAGFGYLSVEVLERCKGVRAMDLYEAEARGLALARHNLEGQTGCALDFVWHDVTTGLLPERRYDFIVSNPPFHQGRADQPGIGKAFIRAAARALGSGGRFWLVANRHLPYEAVLQEEFRRVREVSVEQGYKVIEATA